MYTNDKPGEKIKYVIYIIVIFLICCFFILISRDSMSKTGSASHNNYYHQTDNIGLHSLIMRSSENLSFEQRIACQEKIEKIYWQHRIWPEANLQPKPPFEKIVPHEIIIDKTSDLTKKTNALAYYWNMHINAEQLQAEMNRIAKNTRKPEILQEIWSALNDDPYLVADCLARPVLVDRLIRNWYAYDERFHGETKKFAEKELNEFDG